MENFVEPIQIEVYHQNKVLSLSVVYRLKESLKTTNFR